MKFRTEIKIADAPKNLSPERFVLLTGSCFSDNIGSRILHSGWPAVVNPCGVIYNPISMALLFRLALLQRTLRREILASSITEREGRFVSWFMGSKVSAPTHEECVEKASETIDTLEASIERADAIVLTFGTADVWLLAGTDRAVGNCHKYPAAEFDKRRITVKETVDLWLEIIGAVRERNQEVKFIFTVSPRRYLSEGFADNSRLKAILLLACEEICARAENTYYFPAYEILNDDLRDYRFYAKDLIHPSETAIDYIWEKFCVTFLNDEALEKLAQMEKAANRALHRNIIS